MSTPEAPCADFDTWIICRHKFANSGLSAVITVNSTLESRLKLTDYPYYLSIAIEAEPRFVDAHGRIGAHESQHLQALSRLIRESLDTEAQHLIAIVHGAGARTLALHARDGGAIAGRLKALKRDKTWDRAWSFQIIHDPWGAKSEPWREIARASGDHHLAINIPHAEGGLAAGEPHHSLF
jgi:hypothetical protein